jgi:hypothetical protein
MPCAFYYEASDLMLMIEFKKVALHTSLIKVGLDRFKSAGRWLD